MIQRKQTLFLLLACILVLLFNLHWVLFAIQTLSVVLGLVTVFLYKKRPLQATFALICVLVNLAWYIAMVVLIQQGKQSEQMPITACFPLIAAILCFMARKAILSDERLVRAADRIR